jgi:hypothetical protein
MKPDLNIKKVIIPKADLPAIFSNNFSYNVRFRIVSEDKNRLSHWSHIYNIDATEQIPGVSNKLNYSYVSEDAKDSIGTIIKSLRFNWDVPTDLGISFFDIFVKRALTDPATTETYQYLGTTSSNTYSIFKTGSESHIQVAVQAPTYPKQINSSAYLFETALINI